MLKVPAPLDPGFQPPALLNREYVHETKTSGQAVPLIIGIERENGLLSRFETVVKTEADGVGGEGLAYAERVVKFLLWARGGWRIWVGGPKDVGRHIARCYSNAGDRVFDTDLMRRVYERPVEVMVVDAKSVPPESETSIALGGHLTGCRLGFDLGASDYKIAAIKDGEPVYSEEFTWNPRDQADPAYHYQHLKDGLKTAAQFLPRVDAIGGSSAGIIVKNRIMVSSLFRAVPSAKYGQAREIFLRLHDEWRVPVEVVNDGDVTALAGALSLKTNAVLGIAMGSSQAAGYFTPQGGITGWINELAFAPVDHNPRAMADEWSRDRGVGAQYFSQQAVGKLLPAAGIELPAALDLPERLQEVQQLMAKGDPRAAKVYETIGVYLGYTLPHYAAFYEFSHLLLMGRVTTGAGGELVAGKARDVLQAEFPELAARIQVHVPDEKNRRVGQAMAAASLPALKS